MSVHTPSSYFYRLIFASFFTLVMLRSLEQRHLGSRSKVFGQKRVC